jgi:hypothetical protein
MRYAFLIVAIFTLTACSNQAPPTEAPEIDMSGVSSLKSVADVWGDEMVIVSYQTGDGTTEDWAEMIGSAEKGFTVIIIDEDRQIAPDGYYPIPQQYQYCGGGSQTIYYTKTWDSTKQEWTVHYAMTQSCHDSLGTYEWTVLRRLAVRLTAHTNDEPSE